MAVELEFPVDEEDSKDDRGKDSDNRPDDGGNALNCVIHRMPAPPLIPSLLTDWECSPSPASESNPSKTGSTILNFAMRKLNGIGWRRSSFLVGLRSVESPVV